MRVCVRTAVYPITSFKDLTVSPGSVLICNSILWPPVLSLYTQIYRLFVSQLVYYVSY